ncbi:hypothetical protein F3J14_20965 [Burkholderia sp. Tr-862]|uniref:hypothetical protein n=1 Tax=Burkholderia TaxID=32008 RepID=UPI0014195BB2|nr:MULTISPECIES: hypothetical protein [unclassified Burkholderia]NIF43315.1 hypothetical protein [Burkholderia sp. Tr-862]UEP31121.1 hypothetical protein LMA01_18030 [Burkholderia sp. B21-007]UEP43602.1 hypothetical protein LMA02_26470 [Burkholderia sp. B21-005]
MFFQSLAATLKRLLHVTCDRSSVSPLAHALGNWRGSALAHRPAAPRPLDCLLVGAMAAAVALVALLCTAASHLGFTQAWRIGGWLP